MTDSKFPPALKSSPADDALVDYLQSKVPEGPLAQKWTNHKNNIRLVNPANKRLIDVIVVGTGLAGSSAAASLAEMGYMAQGTGQSLC